MQNFKIQNYRNHLYINLACLFVCFGVSLFVSTKRPNGRTDRAQIFVGHLGTPGKVYEWSTFQIFVSIKIRSSLNFFKFWKSTKFFVKIRELFLFCFTMYTKRKLFTINLEDVILLVLLLIFLVSPYPFHYISSTFKLLTPREPPSISFHFSLHTFCCVFLLVSLIFFHFSIYFSFTFPFNFFCFPLDYSFSIGLFFLFYFFTLPFARKIKRKKKF